MSTRCHHCAMNAHHGHCSEGIVLAYWRDADGEISDTAFWVCEECLGATGPHGVGYVAADLENHDCDRSQSWWARDAQGIELCRVCSICEAAKLSRYRPEILTGYTQADVDEPIEPDGDYPW
jgi:hypothetical protein